MQRRAPRFGEHIAIFNNRVLIASRSAVYIFQLLSNKWQQTGKLPFGRSVQVSDLDWHWNTVVVGASDSTGNAAYVFHMNTDGTFRRIARLAPPDAVRGDRFGERVAVYSTTVAATAPGYNSEQGAAYVFTCTETQLRRAAEAARQRRAARRRLRPRGRSRERRSGRRRTLGRLGAGRSGQAAERAEPSCWRCSVPVRSQRLARGLNNRSCARARGSSTGTRRSATRSSSRARMS